MHRRLRLSFAVTAFASLLVLAPPAFAQNDAAAEVLYEAATAAMDRGDYTAACPKLEKVVRLVPDGIGAKLTLAECYEGAGRLASAWAVYGTARVAAAKAGQADREKKAAAKERALAGRLAQVTLVVPAALREADGLQVQRDGVSVGRPLWGVPVPVDQGQHRVTVDAAGHERWERLLPMKDGNSVTLTVELGESLAPPPVLPPPAPPMAPAIEAPARGPDAPTPVHEQGSAGEALSLEVPSRSFVLPGLALGAAIVGLGVAGVSTGLLLGDKSTIANECDAAKRCSPEGLDAVNEVPTLSAVGTAGFVVGAVGVAGLITWLVWPSSAGESGLVSPALAPGYAGLRVERAF